MLGNSRQVSNASFLRRFNLSQGMLVTLAEIFYYGIIFLTSVVVARVYGATSFGQYSINFFLASILVNIGNSGYTAILRKKLSCKEADDYACYTQSYFLLRMAFGVLLFLLGIVYLSLTQSDRITMIVLFIPLFFSRFVDGLTDITHSVLVVDGRLRVYFLLKLAYCFCCLMIIGITILTNIDIQLFYWLLTIASLIMLIVSGWQYDRLSLERMNVKKSIIIESIKESWPLLVHAAIFTIYARYWIFYADIVFEKKEVAAVSAAMTILSAIALIPNAIATIFYPKLCRLADQASLGELKKFVFENGVYLAITGGVFSLMLYFIAPLMTHLYGQVGYDAILYLRILSFTLIPTFTLAILGYLTTAVNKQRMGLNIICIVLLISLLLCWLMSMHYGLIGLVISYAINQYLMVSILVIYFYIHFKVKKQLI